MNVSLFLAVAWEWLVVLALAFWIGILLYEGVALHGVACAQKQTRPLQWLCLAALFVGTIVMLILRAAQLTATPDLATMGYILSNSTYGALWLARMGLIMLAAGLPVIIRRRRRFVAIARLALAGLLLLTIVYSGNSSLASLPGTKNTSAPVATPSPTVGGNITQSKSAGSMSIMLEVTPAKVELANTVLVTLTDTHSGKLIENAQITATTTMQTMDMGTTRITMSGGKPEYRAMFPADSAFSMFGLWNITLLIRQPGHAPAQVIFTVLLND